MQERCARRAWLAAIVINLALFLPAYSQFSFEPIKSDGEFEFQKPVQVYWTPRYNRVEGLFLNLGTKLRPEQFSRWFFYADAGWSFWNEPNDQRFRFNTGIRRDFADFDQLSIGVDAFRRLESRDSWLVGEVENSLAALLFRDDFKDYYGVTGIRVYAEKKFRTTHAARIELTQKDYFPLARNIDWSVFGGSFAENPRRSDQLIAIGGELGLRLTGALDWRDNPIFPLTGWYLQGTFEHTVDDFDTDGLFITLKRYQQTLANHRLVVRALLGSRSGSLATQHRMSLGGLGSLRAFDDKEFSGNRLFMLNANYFFGGDILQKIPLQNLPVAGAFWSTLSLGAFLDTGWVGLTDIDDGLLSGFDDLTLDNLETNVGVSVLVLDGMFRMDVARRTSSGPGRDDFRVTFRLLESL